MSLKNKIVKSKYSHPVTSVLHFSYLALIFVVASVSPGKAENAPPIPLEKSQQAQQSIADLKLLAERGESEAQAKLGIAFEHGQGTQQDFSQAASWYQKAAAQGDAIAQNNLGKLYSTGEGVHRNAQVAADLYQKSAEQGNALAQANLAKGGSVGISAIIPAKGKRSCLD